MELGKLKEEAGKFRNFASTYNRDEINKQVDVLTEANKGDQDCMALCDQLRNAGNQDDVARVLANINARKEPPKMEKKTVAEKRSQ